MNPAIQGIYAICDNSLSPQLSHRMIAKELLKGGVRLIQLRLKGEKNLAHVKAMAQDILSFKKDFDFTFILNDYVELAAELEVDGIHLGQDDMPIDQARRLVGANCLIGYSSHSLAEALQAQSTGADYVAFGAIFPTASKGPDHPVQGLEKLQEVVASLSVPVVAIGGITRKNLLEVEKTGVQAVAMIRALTCAKDIALEANWFVEQFSP